MSQIERLAARLTLDSLTERGRAIRIHDYVRDRIAFGFTPKLDDATSAETLAAGIGHTIPKTLLFVALLRAAGMRAQPHFVTIDHDILRGIFPRNAHRLLPWEILHAYAEVEVEGRCCRLDSYALDRPLWRATTLRLAEEGMTLGYGAHREGTCRWNGARDAFAQLVTPDMVVEDHGLNADLDSFRQAAAQAGRHSPASTAILALATGAMAAAAARQLNERLDALRVPHPVPERTPRIRMSNLAV